MRGFEYLVYSVFSTMLLTVLIFLPLAPVFASETEVSPSEPDTIINTEPLEVSDENTPLSEPSQIEELIAVPVDELPVVALEEDVVISENAPITEADVNLVEVSEASTNAEDVVEQETNIDIEEPIPGDEEVPNDVTEEPIPVDEEVPGPDTEELVPVDVDAPIIDTEILEPISTDESNLDEQGIDVEEPVVEVPPTPETSTAVNDDNRFSFSKGECTAVGDGTFYCAQPTEKAEILYTDRVFAAPDVDGDMEIFIEKNSELTQITFNTVDDDAPYFDEVSNTLVWHRLIDGRYQIISYDISEEKEEQVTHDRYNNMQPHRYADITVWQGWVGNDWEIFLLKDDELTMLTDNTTHDITPNINGDHIVWQSFLNDVWKMQVYDVRSKLTQTIEDSNGGSIQNPRFVLVYDTKFDSGDVETRGYDLGSGEVIQLGSEPAHVPSKIPDPDQTSEKRALISPPVQPKIKVGEEGDDGSTDPELELPTDPSPIVEGDIIIPSYDGDESISSTTIDTTIDMEQFQDVVIPALDVLGTSTPDHIDDLIVAPFTDEFLPDENPQGGIAS